MNNNLNLAGRLFDIKVIPTKGKLNGFRVRVTLINLDCPNTVLTHIVMCGDAYTVKSLKGAILQRRRINLKYWHWTEVNQDLPYVCTNRFKTKPFTLEI